jgi:hypothetical protein
LRQRAVAPSAAATTGQARPRPRGLALSRPGNRSQAHCARNGERQDGKRHNEPFDETCDEFSLAGSR